MLEGRYVDAETVLKVTLRPEYDPGYKPAINKLKNLEDPEYYNQTLTPKFIDKVQQVKDLLLQAQGFYDSGRYDLAFKRYDQVLTLDPYNNAARKGQERVDLQKARHGDPYSYDETRGRLLGDVSQSWGMPVRKQGLEVDPRRGGNPPARRRGQRGHHAQAGQHHHPQHRVPFDDHQRRHRVPAPGKPPSGHRPGRRRPGREHLPQAARQRRRPPPRAVAAIAPDPTAAAIPGLPAGARMPAAPSPPPRRRPPTPASR